MSQTDVARESRARQPGGSQPPKFRHDPTLDVTSGEWDSDGQAEEWGVAVPLRLSPPQRSDHKRPTSPPAHWRKPLLLG